MAIHRLIAGHSFDPEEIAIMVAAFEAALTVLRMSNTDDPMTEIVARSIIEIAASGERDPAVIADRAIIAAGIKPPNAA
jgi:hypothetical protein